MEVCSAVLHSASAVGNVCIVYIVFADYIVYTVLLFKLPYTA